MVITALYKFRVYTMDKIFNHYLLIEFRNLFKYYLDVFELSPACH